MTHISGPVKVVTDYLSHLQEQQAEELFDTEQPTTKEKPGDLEVCASILDLPTSDYKINEGIVAKAQNDHHTTLSKAEVEPFIITQRVLTFNNKQWDNIEVSSPGESDFRPLVSSSEQPSFTYSMTPYTFGLKKLYDRWKVFITVTTCGEMSFSAPTLPQMSNIAPNVKRAKSLDKTAKD